MTGALERSERAERAEPPGGVERPRRRTGARRIGLTGPIGCGKTTVAGWLGEQAGVVIIDADQAARDVLEPGRPEVEAV
ncbi:MAG: dephospho-CoA kinase, partial [Candidatus Limnocylindrales bacterium]